MVSSRSGLRLETPLIDSHPFLTAMTNTGTLQLHQDRIAKMEKRHEKELTKLKADHDQLEAHVIHPQGDKQSAHTLPEHTQGESHPQCIGNTADDLSL